MAWRRTVGDAVVSPQQIAQRGLLSPAAKTAGCCLSAWFLPRNFSQLMEAASQGFTCSLQAAHIPGVVNVEVHTSKSLPSIRDIAERTLQLKCRGWDWLWASCLHDHSTSLSAHLDSSFSNKLSAHNCQLRVHFMGNLTYKERPLLTSTCTVMERMLYSKSLFDILNSFCNLK